MRVTESGIIDGGGYGGIDETAAALSTNVLSARLSPPPPAIAASSAAESNLYMYGGLLVLAGLVYVYASSRNLLPWAKDKGEAVPQTADVAKMVRAKPKKVDVRVEVLGEEEATLEIATKGLTSARTPIQPHTPRQSVQLHTTSCTAHPR